MDHSVVIKGNRSGITVVLDKHMPFETLKKDVAKKFRESAQFFGNAQMAAAFEGRELSEQEQLELMDVIMENSQMKIVCLVDTDKEKEELFRVSLDRKLDELAAQSGQFYRGTLRSGQMLESEASIVVIGDVNPGAKIVSKGNIIVLGALKGKTYAGIGGNTSAFVVAIEMNPMQIRIADVIARSSDQPKKKIEKGTKIAFIDDGYIYIEPLSREVVKYIK